MTAGQAKNTKMQAASTLRYASRMLESIVRNKPVISIAHIHPSFRCNLHCTYCNFPNLNTSELSTDKWFSVIDQLADLGCRRVAISGGEPLLRQDIPEIIARVRARGMYCTLTSNGLLVSKLIDRLSLLNAITLSLDAVGSENDAVRGEGMFDAVKDAIMAAKGAGLPVKINAVMSAKTAPKLDKLLSFIEEYDLYMTLGLMRSGAPDLWSNAASIKAEDNEIRKTVQRIADLTKTNPRLLFSEATYRYIARWDDYSLDRYEVDELTADDPLLRDGPRCQAGRYYVCIIPDRTAYPCVSTFGRIPGGNVISDGVEEAWRQLHNHKCAACYSPCMVERNYLFSFKPRVILNFIKRHLARFF
jgi:MoaA/NifB/PqqE/SkfB family radical SAM enzyme